LKLLAVDPGEGRNKKTIGVAILDSDRDSVVSVDQFDMEEFISYLEQLEHIDVVVHEDYRIRKNRATHHIGSRVETVQCIGALRSWCTRNGIPLYKQESYILPTAEKFFNMKLPSNHDQSHYVSALLHGMFYLNKLGLWKTYLEREFLESGE
jgi:hypothetical protein